MLGRYLRDVGAVVFPIVPPGLALISLQEPAGDAPLVHALRARAIPSLGPGDLYGRSSCNWGARASR